MSDAYHARMQQTRNSRFHDFLLAWLATLPATGWEGTIPEAVAALDEFQQRDEYRYTVFVPSGSALTKAIGYQNSYLAAAGWRFEQWRTKHARYLGFTRRKR